MINDLDFVAPEAEGLRSEHILRFLERIERNKINLHAFMVVRRGKILAEGYYKPIDEHFKHRLYSSSKTFVAFAIGKLIGEGKLALSDKIVSYFPEYVNGETHKWIRDCTIEDCLKMAVPILCTTYSGCEDWVASCFQHPTKAKALKPAGSVFNYNTSSSFILGVLVEKLTGKTFLEYLRPEFDKIGVSKDIWCVESTDGYAWGGSGVMGTTRDFAKVAELLLYKGEYKGEQLFPRWYMEKMTSKQIDNIEGIGYSEMSSCGYGYQVWIGKDSYSMLGMAGQDAHCFPEKDFLFVYNGDINRNGSERKYIYSLVRDMLYDNLQDEAYETDVAAYAKLQKKISQLELCKDYGESHSDTEKCIDGVRYVLEENAMGWKWVQFDFTGEGGVLRYENERGVKKIPFGLGEFVTATFPETHYYDKRVGVPSGREPNAAFIGNWTENKKLLIRCYLLDTNIANCFMTFAFKGDEIGVMLHKMAEWCISEYSGFAGGEKIKGV